MKILKKILIISFSSFYGFLIYYFPDNSTLKALIPLVTTIISFVICLKSEKIRFNIIPSKIVGSEIKLTIRTHNSTKDTYYVKKIKIGDFPEIIISEEIKPNSTKPFEIVIRELWPSKSRKVRTILFVNKNASDYYHKYSRKILNLQYEISSTKIYKFKNNLKKKLNYE